MRKPLLVFACAVAVTSAWPACRVAEPTRVGFWYEPESFLLPANEAARLGGPLADDELQSIKRISLNELQRAFTGLSMTITDDPSSFWRVRVMQTLPARMTRQLPRAGESLALGMLGGTGAVGFDVVALIAIQLAPADASRQTILDGIGRGIGRVAVHELTHQILGVASSHNDSDPDSYEYGRPDRASQYYGDLHWTTALPLLQQRLGG